MVKKKERDSNIDSFIVPASDDKGHNIHMSMRCAPDWGRQMDKILTSGRFPYQSKGDIVRHGMLRHFKFLEGIEEVPTSILGQINTAIQLMEDEKRAQGFEALMAMLRERVTFHTTGGSIGEARRHVLQTLKCIEEMPDGYWKDRFAAEIKVNYSEMLRSAPKGGLRVIKGRRRRGTSE